MTPIDFRSPNPHKLQRDADNNILAGVCSGLAYYLGTDRNIVRIIWALGLFFFFPVFFFAYIVLAITIEKKSYEKTQGTTEEKEFWRNVSLQPRNTYASIRHTFRKIDRRMAQMENYITSDSYALNRQYEDLKKDDEANDAHKKAKD